jgi:hypothetical protein
VTEGFRAGEISEPLWTEGMLCELPVLMWAGNVGGAGLRCGRGVHTGLGCDDVATGCVSHQGTVVVYLEFRGLVQGAGLEDSGRGRAWPPDIRAAGPLETGN